ncbi:insulinase family protein [Taibaiella sp. KBW10]|uniref:M16 family metallopeptidase n=1 Tax=Taibaiella sp. KBW10 TaxID=2153357 RepID=UPI000F59098A|nr:pitrilysin family protein [Taibaiella sp. KBW10]RQO31953.1 insulinase family protein [Taibaiella sp. KBW10]
MLDRSIAPAIHDAVSFTFELPACQKTVCLNQIPIYWLQAGTQEVVEVSWVFKAGIWAESQTAVAQATAALLKNGTAHKSAYRLNEAIEYYGASLKVTANNDFSTVTLHALSKHLPLLLPVIKEIIAEAIFPEEEVNIYKQNALQRLSVNLRQCDFVANRHIDAFVFGRQHPYGKFTEQPDIEALSSSVLNDFHKKHYSAGNCTIFVSGNFEESNLNLVMDHFGKDSWNDTQATTSIIGYDKQPNEVLKHRINNDPNGVQGAVRMARPFLMRTDPIFAETLVLNTVFGGYFGSRLMANIREEKGFTYGIYSSLISYQYEGMMMIATEAGKDVCEQTVAEIHKEMKLLQDSPIDAEELMLVKNYLLGSILGDLDGPFSIMQRWKNLILNNQTEADFHRSIAVYKNITAERLQELAQQYLNPEAFYELIVV